MSHVKKHKEIWNVIKKSSWNAKCALDSNILITFPIGQYMGLIMPVTVFRELLSKKYPRV